MSSRGKKKYTRQLFEFIKTYHERRRTFAVYARQQSTAKLLIGGVSASRSMDSVEDDGSEDDDFALQFNNPFLQR